MSLSPTRVFLLYVSVIGLCALLYAIFPNWFQNPLTWADSIYFSVVTITTLGYGDIAPVSAVGRIVTASEAILGVVLIGLFLMSLAQSIVARQERERIESAKINLRYQYDRWRKDVVFECLFLASEGGSVSAALAENLANSEAFREYFSENDLTRWYAVANSLSTANHYARSILHEIEALESHIQQFVTTVSPTNPDLRKKLTNFVSVLGQFRLLDLDHYDDQKVFCRLLWQMLALWDPVSGDYGRDWILEAIDEA